MVQVKLIPSGVISEMVISILTLDIDRPAEVGYYLFWAQENTGRSFGLVKSIANICKIVKTMLNYRKPHKSYHLFRAPSWYPASLLAAWNTKF